MRKPKVSLFVPFYNEEERLEKNIIILYNFMEKYWSNFELVLVNDNSSDGSMLIVNDLIKKFKKLRCITYMTGPSRRENLARAFREAKGSIIAYTDVDLSADYTILPYLFEWIQQTDIIIGSKYMSGAKVKRSYSRWFISVVTNLFIKMWHESYINDHCCGLKVFRKKVLFDLLDEMGYDSKFERGMLWDAELLIRAQNKKYTIAEFGIKWTESNKSSLGILKDWRMIPYIIKLKGRL